MEKTNVMRILEQKKIPYQYYEYQTEEALSGTEVAKRIGQEESKVFKTLVCVGASNKNYVFVTPVSKELDLKKAAKVAGEKKMDMLKAKELLPLTGYVHGGCSPIGMKKLFPTFIEESAKTYESIIFSAGKIGYQVEVTLELLNKLISPKYEAFIQNEE